MTEEKDRRAGFETPEQLRAYLVVQRKRLKELKDNVSKSRRAQLWMTFNELDQVATDWELELGGLPAVGRPGGLSAAALERGHGRAATPRTAAKPVLANPPRARSSRLAKTPSTSSSSKLAKADRQRAAALFVDEDEPGESDDFVVPSSHASVELRHERVRGRAVTYQLRGVLCGKAHCRKFHGPYWYAFWKQERRVRTVYIGKSFRSLTFDATGKPVKAAAAVSRPAAGRRRTAS